MGMDTGMTPQTNYDSPWKEILERFFPECMTFFFPTAQVAIDWSQGYAFMDKELQQVVRDAETGSRRVDKLVKVTLRESGEEAWVLIHIEVQGDQEAAFARRMYIYNYRLFDKYDRRVASFALLSDDNPTWRPDQFGYELLGCRVQLDFPTVKLLDYESRWAELEASDNPFAVVVMAQLETRRTRQEAQARYEAKLRLAKRLYQRGYSRRDILEIIGNKQSLAEARRRKENFLCASASLRDIKLFPIKSIRIIPVYRLDHDATTGTGGTVYDRYRCL